MVAGNTRSLNLPVTPGAFDPTYNGDGDGFVTHVSADGDTLLNSTYIGGNASDSIRDLAVDEAGNVYVVGTTQSANFPTTPGCYDPIPNGGRDGFVCELSADGFELIYSTFLGGGSNDDVNCCALSDSGALVVGGSTSSSNFPVTVGAFDTTQNGALDGFATRLNSTGTGLEYSTFVGGNGDDDIQDVVVDDADRPCFTGSTVSPDFPSTIGSFDRTFNGDRDAIVIKLAADASSVVFGGFLGGGRTDTGCSISTDTSGALYVCGNTSSQDFPTTPGAYDRTYNRLIIDDGYPYDVWLAKVSPDGTSLLYGSYLGGTSTDVCGSASVSDSGLVVVVGYTSSTDFPRTTDAEDSTLSGFEDGFLAVVDLGSSTLRYSTFIGGSSYDRYDVIASRNGRVFFLGGDTHSFNFPVQGFGVQDNNSACFSRFKIGTTDTPGVYIPSTAGWFLRNTNSPGVADLVFSYGPANQGWVVVKGDWDGDGDDTPGLYDPSTGSFFLRNSSAPGPADIVFSFGPAGGGWKPISGDWNGDGKDTIGLYDPSSGSFFLKNSNTSGSADKVYGVGPLTNWTPLSGDWDGDGVDTVGLYDNSSGFFFLHNSHGPGPADLVFSFGPGGVAAIPVTGDWDSDGDDSVGLFDRTTGTFFLKFENTPGAADLTFGYGPAQATPLAGDWDGQ